MSLKTLAAAALVILNSTTFASEFTTIEDNSLQNTDIDQLKVLNAINLLTDLSDAELTLLQNYLDNNTDFEVINLENLEDIYQREDAGMTSVMR